MTSSLITESLLEMYYFDEIKNFFETRYNKQFLRILKPSPYKEKWYGFDQGWVITELDEKTLYQQLKGSTVNKSRKINKFYIGFFLQYKLVKKMIGKNSTKFDGYKIPHIRCKLDLKKNKETGKSQHETLISVNKIKDCNAGYACPMILDYATIYNKPDLNLLKIVSVDSAPNYPFSRKKHFIVFQDKNDSKPSWFSKPIPTEAVPFPKWITKKDEVFNNAEKIINTIKLIKEEFMIKGEYQKKLIGEDKELLESSKDKVNNKPEDKEKNSIPSNLTIFEFADKNDI